MPTGPQPTELHRLGSAHVGLSQAAGEPGVNYDLSPQAEDVGRLCAS